MGLYLSVVISAIRDPPVCIIPHQWASPPLANVFSVTAVIDKSLKYKFPPHVPTTPSLLQSPPRKSLLWPSCRLFTCSSYLCWLKAVSLSLPLILILLLQEDVMDQSSLTPAVVRPSRASWASPTRDTQWVRRWAVQNQSLYIFWNEK